MFRKWNELELLDLARGDAHEDVLQAKGLLGEADDGHTVVIQLLHHV